VQTRVRVALSGGREVWLRAIGDEDETFILDTAGALLPGARATALVARCLTDGESQSRTLTVGDREALLLHLRRLSLGESIDCVLRCPAASCSETLECRLQISDLLMPQGVAADPGTVIIDAGGARFRVSFRPPAAADVDHAAALITDDIEHAAMSIFERCVVAAERDAVPITAAEVPATVRMAVEAAMAAANPQAEIQLAMRCPACGNEFTSLFDTATFFLRELDERATRTLHDVHALAQHYHWSEADILRLPARRRSQYIELVREAKARGRAQ
jgi:hypothetical protein